MSSMIKSWFGQESTATVAKQDGSKLSENEEEKKVGLMRTFVEQKDPTANVVDNPMLRRFLRACDSGIDKASALFLKYLQWKRTVIPNGFISETEIRNELSQEKAYMQGFDKAGGPIIIIFGAKHIYSKRNMNEFKRLVVYILEKACFSMQVSHEKLTCIIDLKDWGYSNCDIRVYIAALDIIQNCYPERLGKMMLIHVPFIFMKAWKAVYPFIDKNTRKKIFFVEDNNLKATLLEDIDENSL